MIAPAPLRSPRVASCANTAGTVIGSTLFDRSCCSKLRYSGYLRCMGVPVCCAVDSSHNNIKFCWNRIHNAEHSIANRYLWFTGQRRIELQCNGNSCSDRPYHRYHLLCKGILQRTIPTSNGTFNICITDPVPANNDCAGAIALTAGSTCINTTGSMISSTLSTGIPATACGTPTRMYGIRSWPMFPIQLSTLSSLGAGFTNPAIQILSGTCGSLTNVTCATGSTITPTGLTIGTTYYIRVYSTTAVTSNGIFNICVTNPQPANDDCAGAVTLTSGATCTNIAGNMVGATLTGSVVAPELAAHPVTYDCMVPVCCAVDSSHNNI